MWWRRLPGPGRAGQEPAFLAEPSMQRPLWNLQSSLGMRPWTAPWACGGEVSHGSRARDHKRAEQAKLTDPGLSNPCLRAGGCPGMLTNIKPTLFVECVGAQAPEVS